MSRVFWMMIGPLALMMLTLAIVNAGPSWLTAADFAFLVVLGATILARCLEFRVGNPQTATGEPATTSQLRRYVVSALALGLAVFIVANLVANHWLAR